MIYADHADVIACYRLLLGREPDEGGLKNFSKLVENGSVLTTDLSELFILSNEFLQIKKSRSDLSKHVKRVAIKNFGFLMDVCPQWNQINFEISSKQSYEPYVVREIIKYLGPGKTFVDCGANVGFYSLLGCHCGADVWSFEPNNRNVALLVNNLRVNGFHANVFPAPVANDEHLVVYNVTHGNGQMDSINCLSLAPEQEVLRTLVLDKVLSGIRVDVIKMDIEGAEGLALKGAAVLLEQRPTLFIEFSPDSIEAISQMAPYMLLEELFSLGYQATVLSIENQRVRSPEDVRKLILSSDQSFVDLKLEIS